MKNKLPNRYNPDARPRKLRMVVSPAIISKISAIVDIFRCVGRECGGDASSRRRTRTKTRTRMSKKENTRRRIK